MPLPTRTEALAILHEFLSNEYLLRHSFASEAVLRALAGHLGHDESLWGITGLLHDLDLELVGNDMSQHGRRTVDILRERFDFPREALDAILAHNGDVLGIECVSPFDHALTAGESITGMVFAMARVLPSKSLRDVKAKSVAKRIDEPRFAANISRERLHHYAALGLDRATFCTIAVQAMQTMQTMQAI